MEYVDMNRIKHEIKVCSGTWTDHVTSSSGQRRGEMSRKPDSSGGYLFMILNMKLGLQ